MKHILLFIAISALALMPFRTADARQAAEIPESPKHEFRSVWIATAVGLDFPKTTNPAQAELALRNIIRNMKSKGMNAVVFQVVPRGDAYYQSERLPWARRLTGTMGQDPGWDPLAVAIEESHLHGMELHAWYNVGKLGDIGSSDLQDTEDGPRHVYFDNPDLVEVSGSEVWLSHGKPHAREWAVANVLEIVDNYDVDAVHFDFIRYPTGAYASDFDVRQEYNPENLSMADWRRYNITEFNRAIYDSIQARKPWVKVGSTPVGHYRLSGSWGALYGYTDVYQDSRGWLQKGVNDYIAPQLYWDIGGGDAPQFDWLVRDWMGETHGRHYYIGTAPYKTNVFPEIPRQIDSTRVHSAPGQIHFRYDNIVPATTFGDRYDLPSIVPPMPWKNMTEPGMPVNLLAEANGTDVTLTWQAPEFGRGVAEARRFAIYRAPSAGQQQPLDSSEFLIALTGETTYTDGGGFDLGEYDYYVTALSHNNVESEAAWTGTFTSIGDEDQIARHFRLEQNYPNPFNPTTSIRFTLGEAGPVSITVYDLLGRVVDRPLNETRAAGTHTISFNASHLASGVYLYRLESGSQRITKKMMLLK